MEIGVLLLTFVVSYLFGSLSFARLVTQWWSRGEDVTKFEVPVEGTGESYKVISIGANSVSSVLGPKAGMAVSLLDIFKVFLPTLLAKLLFPDQPIYMLVAAIGGLVGHVWPLYYRFHGGSGFSAIMGGLLVIDWLAVIVSPIAGLLLGMLVFRNMVVASLSWLWLLIPWFWWRSHGDVEYIIYALILNLLFILAMIPEIKMARKYEKEGKRLEYGLGSMKSHPMGRSMLKIAKFFGVEIK